MEILNIKNLSKIYGVGGNTVRALQGIDLSIEKGSFASIIGRSGSGKSTLLNIIGGLDRPTGGNVFIEGTDLFLFKDRDLTEFRRKRIGYVFQAFNLIPEFNVYENICLPAYLDNSKPDFKFIDEVISQLEIVLKRDKYPAELSGGEQQRVAIARALSTKPAILLADEPTGNLDVKSGELLMELLRYCHRKFCQTTLLVTHNVELARTAERMITLEDGKIVSDRLGDDLI